MISIKQTFNFSLNANYEMFQIKKSVSDDGWIMYIPSMIPNFLAVSLEKVKVMWNYFNAILIESSILKIKF